MGPLLVSYISQTASANGVAKTAIYDTTLYVMAVLLVIGLVANFLIRPLAAHHFMAPAEVAALQEDQGARSTVGGAFGIGLGGLTPGVAVAWLFVLLPIAWGVWMTLSQVANLF